MIETPDGSAVELPAASLDETDRRVIEAATGKHLFSRRNDHDESHTDLKPPDQRYLPESVKQVEANALHCRTAADAMLVYRLFLAQPTLSESDRKEAESRLFHWAAMEKDGRVRLGSSWVTADERKVIEIKADQMVQHARELLRLNQFRLAERELTRASELNPESGKAAFLLGLVASLVNDDDHRGASQFQEAIRRDPNNSYAYNNLALCNYYARRTTSIAENFKRSLELSPDPQPIADNIGKIIALVGFRKAVVPDKHLAALNDLYRMALRELNLEPLRDDESLGLKFLSPYGKAWDQKDGDKDDRGIAEADEVYASSGTGFVIASGHVLTNHHVIEGAESVAIQDSSEPRKLLSATVLASTREPDLALLRCEQLRAPALPMQKSLPGRGTDIMVLGFPKGTLLGPGVKSTRGAIVAMPDPTLGGFLHSAVTNPGNSGGPIVDDSGAVIGVVRAVFRREFIENTYSIGIPVQEIWPFLSTHLPTLNAAGSSLGSKPWVDVDAMVSESTVYIQCSKRVR